MADFRRRLAWADANDPTAITRLLRNGVAVAKKAAPGTGTSESGKANNCTSIDVYKRQRIASATARHVIPLFNIIRFTELFDQFIFSNILPLLDLILKSVKNY